MRTISDKGFRRHAVVLLALALAVPLFNGCSQLGIATADDLTAMEARLQSTNSATDTRVNTLEQNSADMQQTLTEITTSIDTLNARFARAKVWIETMNIDTISSDVQKASKQAMSAESSSRAFLEHYLEWIKAQQALLEKQVTALEAKLKANGEGEAKSPGSTGDKSSEKPADSGGGDGG
jgi:chaperonin cofactor prefoldin